MTPKEAITMLRRIQEPEAWESQINEAAFEALEMAISALETQTSAEEITSPLLTEKWNSRHRRIEP